MSRENPSSLPNRRDLFATLAALTAVDIVDAQTPPDPAAKLIHSHIFAENQLPVHAQASWGASRSVIEGTLATGEFVEVHESTLLPGQMPHPPHRHTHSEFLLIRNGKLEVTSDGQQGVVQAGGVIFTASGVLHGLKNIGDIPASYFVVAVGHQQTIV